MALAGPTHRNRPSSPSDRLLAAPAPLPATCSAGPRRGCPDRTRRAVTGAEPDQAAGLARSHPGGGRRVAPRRHSVRAGPSRHDAVVDAALWRSTSALAPLGESAALPDAALPVDDQACARIRQRRSIGGSGGPITAAGAARSWTSFRPGCGSRAPSSSPSVSWVYDEQWPAEGFPVEVSSYANWAGAYSTGDRLLVMSSFDPGAARIAGARDAVPRSDAPVGRAMQERLEGGDVTARARAACPTGFCTRWSFTRQGRPSGGPCRLTFHTPRATASGRRGPLAAFKPRLDSAWRPHLRGDLTLTEALDRLAAGK